MCPVVEAVTFAMLLLLGFWELTVPANILASYPAKKTYVWKLASSSTMLTYFGPVYPLNTNTRR